MSVIELKDVSVQFGDVKALDEVSLSVESGDFVAIIGPNGAGKSTLLDVLLGLRKADSGTVQVDGLEHVGYIPQRKEMDRRFPGQAMELVMTGFLRTWPWRKTRMNETARAHEALERVGASYCAGKQITELSGGELQRVYLARSLVRDPKLLILDEPGAGMDLTGEADMYHRLLEYQQETNATVLMITHDWEGARVHADKVLLLDRRVVAYGDAKEVMDEEQLLHLFHHRGHVHHSHVEEGCDHG